MIDFKDVSKLIIYKNLELAGRLERTVQGCELILAPHFIENSKTPYFSYCIPKNTSNIIITAKAINSLLDNLLYRFIKHYQSLYSIEMKEKKQLFLQSMITKRIHDLQ